MLGRPWLLIFLVLATGVLYAQTGLIRGTLLDGQGNPVAQANVFAMFFLHCGASKEAKVDIGFGEQDRCLSTWDGRVDATTDKAGRFELQGLQWGMYELAAQKVEDGYRPTFRNLFTGEAPVRVGLSPSSPYANLILHFPPKCALLTGTVRNAKTGEVLSSVELRLRPTEGNGYYESDGVNVPMHELMPAERAFTLEITARGFETWLYRNSFNETSVNDAPATPVKLQAGQRFSLDIALAPKP